MMEISAPLRRIWAHDKRSELITLMFIALFFSGMIALYFLFNTDNAQQVVDTGKVEAKDINPSADAQLPGSYKAAKDQQNAQRYAQQSNTEGGVHMPFTYSDPSSATETSSTIESCGCKIDEAQLVAALRRLGLNGQSNDVDNMRVAESDIYIAGNGSIVSSLGEPLKYNNNPFLMDRNGALVDDNNIALLSRNGEPLYLGKEGQLFDKLAQELQLRGDLLTLDGRIILGDGRLAIREGNMLRVASTDIYLTRDGQLVTLDGKPILHSGGFVFRDAEQNLINNLGGKVSWEGKGVSQNIRGELVDASGRVFERPGILFSYGGILINNKGLLTQPLLDLTRIGQADILKNSKDQLVDTTGGKISHYTNAVSLGTNGILLASSVGQVVNQNKAQVFLVDDGRLRTDVGLGGVRAGVLKTSDGTALDNMGQMLSRQGKVSRRGLSSIYVSTDGLVTGGQGKPFKYLNKDIFLDYSAYLPASGAQGLITFDGTQVLDRKNHRIYLTREGALVNEIGQPTEDVGVITNSAGVLVDAQGSLINNQSSGHQ